MIPEHEPNKDCEYLKEGSCYYCCEACNYDKHFCHFCGDPLNHNGYGNEKGEKVRHYLSDCRPDLVEHEPGELCTWHGLKEHGDGPDCYAYQDRKTNKWTNEHKHFYSDGKTG